ncbi:hypothetical protein G6F24_016454 [Rhizopus arrhizus]|nr:hypothetical protein G6F24_016454 [Rhizopus arrhizus]
MVLGALQGHLLLCIQSAQRIDHARRLREQGKVGQAGIGRVAQCQEQLALLGAQQQPVGVRHRYRQYRAARWLAGLVAGARAAAGDVRRACVVAFAAIGAAGGIARVGRDILLAIAQHAQARQQQARLCGLARAPCAGLGGAQV